MSTKFLHLLYNRINSTRYPASGTGNISKPRLISHVKRVCKVVCTLISVFL